MAAYNWARIMEMKTVSQLEDIVNNNTDGLDTEALEAAEYEIKKRIENKSFKTEPEFPEKPALNEKKQFTKKSITSLALFIAAFYFIFKWDIQYIIILTIVVLIHELGHFISMKLYKYKDLNIFFIPLIGAFASGEKENISQKQKTIISLAGPLPGVIIGSLLIGFGITNENESFLRIGNIFIILNLFNLLPLLPLDGGHIIKSLFFKDNQKINIVFIWISIAVTSFIALKLESYFLLLIPFFLFIEIKNQTQINSFKAHLKNKGFETNRDFKDLSNDEYWLIRDDMAANIKGLSNLIEPKRYVPSHAEDRVINVMKQVFQKQPIQDINVGGKILFLFLWLITFLIPLITITLVFFHGLIRL